MIVLTADRPPELLECGANQAILQQNMFADYPVVQINLPRPTQDYSADWLIFIRASLLPIKQNKGVVHINIPFRTAL